MNFCKEDHDFFVFSWSLPSHFGYWWIALLDDNVHAALFASPIWPVHLPTNHKLAQHFNNSERMVPTSFLTWWWPCLWDGSWCWRGVRLWLSLSGRGTLCYRFQGHAVVCSHCVDFEALSFWKKEIESKYNRWWNQIAYISMVDRNWIREWNSEILILYFCGL